MKIRKTVRCFVEWALCGLAAVLVTQAYAMLPPGFPGGPPWGPPFDVSTPDESYIKFNLAPDHKFQLVDAIELGFEGFVGIVGDDLTIEIGGDVTKVDCQQVEARITTCTFIGTGRKCSDCDEPLEHFGSVVISISGVSKPTDVRYFSILR